MPVLYRWLARVYAPERLIFCAYAGRSRVRRSLPPFTATSMGAVSSPPALTTYHSVVPSMNMKRRLTEHECALHLFFPRLYLNSFLILCASTTYRKWDGSPNSCHNCLSRKPLLRHSNPCHARCLTHCYNVGWWFMLWVDS